MKFKTLPLLIVSFFLSLNFSAFAQPMTPLNDENYEEILDLANLSARVYDNLWDTALDAIAPTLFPDLDYVGNTSHYTKVKVYHECDFYAALFRNENTGKYVLTFRGTEALSIKDWVADLNQVLSDYLNIPTGQYDKAVEIAAEVKNQYGAENLTLTGHSLGGGLAQTAALANNLRGICYEAAGITQHTLDRYGITLNLNTNKQKVIHINVRWDPLSDFDGKKNAESPFSHTLQYGAETIWLEALPGTRFTINPLRIVNHFYHTFVYQLTYRKFLDSDVYAGSKKALFEEHILDTSVLEELGATNLEMKLFPNPTIESVQVNLNAKGIALLNIMSLDGKVIQTSVLTNEQTELNVSDLETGMYIIQVQFDDQIVQKKLLKN